MAKKRNGAATTAGSTLSRLTEQFQVQAMRLRLWAQKEYGKRSVQNLMKGSDDEKASAVTAMAAHVMGPPPGFRPVVAQKEEDFVAAIEARGAQLLDKLDPAETDDPSGISEESD